MKLKLIYKNLIYFLFTYHYCFLFSCSSENNNRDIENNFELLDEYMEQPSVEITDELTIPDGAEKTPIGGACSKNDDCIAPEGLTPVCQTIIFGYSLPGGYCSAICTGTGTCGPNAECLNPLIQGLCVKKCASNSDCRVEEGYICDLIPMLESMGTFCIPNL